MEEKEAAWLIKSLNDFIGKQIVKKWVEDYDEFGFKSELLSDLFNNYVKEDVITTLTGFASKYDNIQILNTKWKGDVDEEGNYDYNVKTDWKLKTIEE